MIVAGRSIEAEMPVREARIRRATRVRGLYLAIRRTFHIVHRYRAECCARREAWREDSRIRACMEQVAKYRAEIRALRGGRTT